MYEFSKVTYSMRHAVGVGLMSGLWTHWVRVSAEAGGIAVVRKDGYSNGGDEGQRGDKTVDGKSK